MAALFFHNYYLSVSFFSLNAFCNFPSVFCFFYYFTDNLVLLFFVMSNNLSIFWSVLVSLLVWRCAAQLFALYVVVLWYKVHMRSHHLLHRSHATQVISFTVLTILIGSSLQQPANTMFSFHSAGFFKFSFSFLSCVSWFTELIFRLMGSRILLLVVAMSGFHMLSIYHYFSSNYMFVLYIYS